VERIFAKQKCVSAPPSFHPTPLLKVLLINYMIMDFKKLKKKRDDCVVFSTPSFSLQEVKKKKNCLL
jgi:hypothetical protein